MTTKAEFNAAEWTTVAAGPAVAAIYVSAAESGGTLRESLAASRAYGNARSEQAAPLLRDLLSSPPTVDAGGATSSEELRKQAPDKLRAAVTTLERHATQAEIDEYKRFVYSVAEAVAHAHKEGGFLGVGGREVSEREQAALDEIGAIFDEPPRADAAPNAAVEARKGFTADEARAAGESIGIDWSSAPFDVEQFRQGMDVELEHGLHDPRTNVTDDDPAFTAKIALAHLNEFPDYYTRLAVMESEAEREHGGG